MLIANRDEKRAKNPAVGDEFWEIVDARRVGWVE
jgi:hypothetical protein